MAATLSSLNVALKRRWTQETLEHQLYNETPFLDKLKKTDRYTVGETARVPLLVSRNGAFTSLPAGGGTLNTAGNVGLQKAEFNYTNHHQPIAVQGDAIDGTRGNANAIVEAADLEIKGALEVMNRQLSRMTFMSGDALIAQCRTSDSNNVDLNKTTGPEVLERGWIFVGQQVMLGTTENSDSVSAGTTVTDIDETNVAFTVASGNVTTEGTTTYVSQKGGRLDATSYEANGLPNIFGTGSLGGLTSETEPTWQATVNSTAAPLTLSLLLQAKQKINQKRGKAPTFLVTGLKQQRKFYEALQQQVRYSSDTVNGGADQTAKFDGMDIWAEPDCRDTQLFLGHYDHLFIVALDKPYWQNKITGGDTLVWNQGTDEYVAKVTYRYNLGANRRNDGYAFTALT